MRIFPGVFVAAAVVITAGTALANPHDIPPMPNSLTFYDGGQVLGTFEAADFVNVDSCASGDSCEMYRVGVPTCNWWIEHADAMEGSVTTWFAGDVDGAYISENGTSFSTTQNDTSNGYTHTISEPNVSLDYSPYTSPGQYNYVMEWRIEDPFNGSIHWIAFAVAGAYC